MFNIFMLFLLEDDEDKGKYKMIWFRKKKETIEQIVEQAKKEGTEIPKKCKEVGISFELLSYDSPLGRKLVQKVIEEFGHERGSWSEFDLRCFNDDKNHVIGRMDLPNTLAVNQILKRITLGQKRIPTFEEAVKFGELLPHGWSYTSTVCVFPKPSTVNIYEHFNENLRQEVLQAIGIKETGIPLLVDGLEVRVDPSAVYVDREKLIRRNREEGIWAAPHPNYKFKLVAGEDIKVTEAPFLAAENCKTYTATNGRERPHPLWITHDGKEYKFGTKDEEPFYLPLHADHLEAFEGLTALLYNRSWIVFDKEKEKSRSAELKMNQGFLGSCTSGPDLTIINDPHGMSGRVGNFKEIYEKEIAVLSEQVRATLVHYAESDPQKLKDLLGK